MWAISGHHREHSRPRFRIALTAHEYVPHIGGVETVVLNLASRLASRHDVVVVTSAFDSRSGVEQAPGLAVHRVPVLRTSEAFGVPYPIPRGEGLRAAWRAISDADVVHVHGSLYPHSMLGVIAAARSRIPVVVTEHVGFVPYRSLALNAVQRLAWGTVGRATLRAAGAAVAVNDRIASWLRNSTHGLAVRCIANGVCTERFRPEPAAARAATRARFGLPNDRMLALVVAREAEKKNVDAVLRSADSDYHIVVCGAERDLAVPGVTSLGTVPYDDMPSLFAAVDALLHLGVSEGFPVAVQEAMASGLPVVLLWDAAYATVLSAATVEGIPDLASVRPALRGLAADPARRETLGNAARAFAQEQWSWDAVIDAYEAVYAEVVGVVRVPRHAAPLRWPSGEHRAP